MLLDVFSADVHIAFLYVSDMQSRCGSSSLVCSEPRCHIKIIGRTQSTSPESRLHTAGSEPPSPHHPTIRRVYTGPGSLLGGHACVCSPHHLRGSAARPGLPAGIYWLALCPTAGRLVRSVLTTSAPQRHLWTINSDTKAVGTTAEPTHAANRCFTMRPRRRKLLKHHWQRGFGMPVNGGVIRRALAHCGEKVRTQLHDSARQSNCKRESQWPKEKASNVADSFTFKFDQTPCLFPNVPESKVYSNSLFTRVIKIYAAIAYFSLKGLRTVSAESLRGELPLFSGLKISTQNTRPFALLRTGSTNESKIK